MTLVDYVRTAMTNMGFRQYKSNVEFAPPSGPAPKMETLEAKSVDQDLSLSVPEYKPKLKDVKPEDYPTPQKYLDGAEIPTYYVFQSNMVVDEDLKPGMLRQLEVDKRLTLPTRTHIRFLITGTDVIHSWAVPSLGIKADATPGRLHKIHTFIQREGVFYGQCSEYCGTLHGFMPIVVEAVAPETYAAHARKWYRE
mmetsp:Transcript_22676/g.55942  ORF Transcript_22676/g.55942 Transcript_22676/m.55942 type:complete len:196 (-) Transcript_22676:538-1125(-)